jgi:hypothetical protein
VWSLLTTKDYYNRMQNTITILAMRIHTVLYLQRNSRDEHNNKNIKNLSFRFFVTPDNF